MAASFLIRFINPSKYRREQLRARVDVLRERDGDSCRRCRRAIRFDLPVGHDLGARIEDMAGVVEAGGHGIASQFLTHGRCNVGRLDHSDEVAERLRPQREADLFAKAREQRAA
ncbi:MAG: hypothetical protein ABIO43_12610 [Sphingomicrobium sp.]